MVLPSEKDGGSSARTAPGLGIRLPAEVAVAGVVIIVITGVAVVAILSSADESRPNRGVDVR